MDLLTFDKRVRANVLSGSFSRFNVFEGYIITQTNSRTPESESEEY